MDNQPKTRKESKKSAKDKKSFYSTKYVRQKVSMLETNAGTTTCGRTTTCRRTTTKSPTTKKT